MSRASKRRKGKAQPIQIQNKKQYALGFNMKGKVSNDGSSNTVAIYENPNFGMCGWPKGYDVDMILRNKQDNIYLIYDLMNYYCDIDSIFNSCIKRVLTPFSVSSGWKLQGISERNKNKYTDYFDLIGIDNLCADIFYDLYLYGQCFLYDRQDYIEILPPRRIRISSISVGGQPILEFQIIEFVKNYTMAKEKYIDTLLAQYKGYPEEILEGIRNGETWVQLNPQNTYAVQLEKSRWAKYAMPIGVSCLKSFAKKTLIGEYENALLNVGMKSFLHVKVGDKDVVKTASSPDLRDIGSIFKDAINGFPLAVTAWNVQSEWVQVNVKDMFDKSKYAEVNTEILSAIGISSIIATGDSSGSNFASASINVSTVQTRIHQNQNKVVLFIKWLMAKRATEWRISKNKIPQFLFNPANLQNDSNFKDEVLKIYQQGLISKQTAIDDLEYSYDQELERKKTEVKEKLDDVFTIPPSFNNQAAGENGRPVVKDSDKDKSNTGKQPMPSDSK